MSIQVENPQGEIMNEPEYLKIKRELDILIGQYDKHLITRPDLVRCLITLLQSPRK